MKEKTYTCIQLMLLLRDFQDREFKKPFSEQKYTPVAFLDFVKKQKETQTIDSNRMEGVPFDLPDSPNFDKDEFAKHYLEYQKVKQK